MNDLFHHLVHYGYSVLFVFVVAEQSGLPVPAIPVLLAVGALAGLGEFSFPLALLTAVFAAVVGDFGWYLLGRYRGRAVLNLVCRVSFEPDSCVRMTQDSFQKHGAKLLLFSKFVPGLSTAAPPLAAIMKMPILRFVAWDVAGSSLWAGLFIGLGYVFRTQLEDVALLAAQLGFGLIVLLAVGLAGYVGKKLIQRRRFLRMIRTNRISPVDLMERIGNGERVFVADLRHELDLANDPVTIPGAIQMSPLELGQRHQDLPRDREIVLYCSCPNQATSAHMALELHRHGITKVRPLQGGFEAWREAGFPVEPLAAQIAGRL